MKKLSTEEFITRAKGTHGNKYDYSKTTYLGATKKVIIICSTHGEFSANPNWHISGIGCPYCSGKAKKTTESFIKEAKSIHGDEFDYSEVVYKNNKQGVVVTCSKGHRTTVQPQNHLRGHKCGMCTGKHLWTTEEFINKSKLKHGNKYDYRNTEYHSASEKVEIICNIHGSFSQIANLHVSGQGCPKCQGRDKSTDTFIKEAKEIHGDLFDYSKAVYSGSKNKLTIICKQHGDFEQTPNSHLKGRGCPSCAGNAKLTTDSFINKAKIVHGDRYNYNKTMYGTTNKDVVTIICKDHGEFTQRAFDHLQGCGCPNCNNYGKLEQELRDYIESLGVITTKDRSVLDGKEIDIFVPSHNIGFEFNGLFWHSEKRAKDPVNSHAHKTRSAKDKDVRLIHVYEDDWLTKTNIVKSIIRNSLGLEKSKLFARDCRIEEIKNKVADSFMDSNHILGSVRGVYVSLAIIKDNNVVSVMQFSKSASHRGKSVDGEYELIRFSSNTKVIGGASKLFSYFVKKYSPSIVTSYSDNDMFDGGVYKILGFNHVSDVPPDYKIIDGSIRKHKSNFRKLELAKRFPEKYDPDLTERENCWNMGLYRIYNSGLKKWLWNKPTAN